MTDALHVAEIYDAHLPNFEVLFIPNEMYDHHIKNIYEVSTSAQDSCIDRKEGITVFANITSIWFIRAYRILHPNRKIILRFHDLLDGQVAGNKMSRSELLHFVSSLRKEGIINEVESYCREDAQVLGGFYRPNGVNPKFLQSIDVPYRNQLFCFIGSENSTPSQEKTNSRISVLSSLQKELSYEYQQISRWCTIRTTDQISFWLPYSEFVKLYACSEVYIDLFRVQENEGYSFRIPEAL